MVWTKVVTTLAMAWPSAGVISPCASAAVTRAEPPAAGVSRPPLRKRPPAHLPSRLILHPINHRHLPRVGGSTPRQRDQPSYIMLMGQFFGYSNSQSTQPRSLGRFGPAIHGFFRLTARSTKTSVAGTSPATGGQRLCGRLQHYCNSAIV